MVYTVGLYGHRRILRKSTQSHDNANSPQTKHSSRIASKMQNYEKPRKTRLFTFESSASIGHLARYQPFFANASAAAAFGMNDTFRA